MVLNVVAQVLGGSKQVFDGVETVKAVRDKLSVAAGYAATVNGEPAADTDELSDGDVVMFAPAVKGGGC